jgi:glyoxylase-like metal-dependent hydrolase (beta-lactamase superfamily II)
VQKMRINQSKPADFKILWIAVALCLLALLTSHSDVTKAQEAPRPVYEVYAVKYATLTGFPVAALVSGADPARKLDIAMMVWVIRGNGRTVVFDSGFYHDQFLKQWSPKEFLRASDAITQSGITPAIHAPQVTDVVISHMHWDHADGVDLFPNARVWLQQEEFHYYSGEAWQHKDTHGGIDPDDVLTVVKLNLQGRVGFVHGDAQELLPGITAYTGGKHTYQSQFLSVNTRAGIVVLASDNMYLYENLDKHVPIAQTLDATSNLAAQDRMKQIAAANRLIIPGHDPAVLERFPKVGERAVRID